MVLLQFFLCSVRVSSTTIKRKICTPKFDVFSFVLRTRGTPSLAPLDPKMQKNIVYKTAYVTWCCYSLVVVNFGFPCLYFALSLGVRQSRFASFFLLPSPFLDAFTAHICRLHTYINICFAHIECHCKSRGVKTTRRQSVGPAGGNTASP